MMAVSESGSSLASAHSAAAGPSRSTTKKPWPVAMPMLASGICSHHSRMRSASKVASLQPCGDAGILSLRLSGWTGQPARA